MWQLNIQKFRRFAPSDTRFNNFGHFSLPENREEISIFASRGGGKNKDFWPKYLPLESPLEKFTTGIFFLLSLFHQGRHQQGTFSRDVFIALSNVPAKLCINPGGDRHSNDKTLWENDTSPGISSQLTQSSLVGLKLFKLVNTHGVFSRGRYFSRKVTGVCGPEKKKITHPTTFFPSLRPLSTDFWRTFFHNYHDFSQLFDDYLHVYHSFWQLFDDYW